MSRVFGSSGRRSNPMGVLAIITGIAGALASAVLWIYRIEPDSRLLGRFSDQVARGGIMAEQLAALAAVLGVMAIVASIVSSSGGQGGGYFIGFILGLAALSYPLLTWLDIISGPLSPGFLNT